MAVPTAISRGVGAASPTSVSPIRIAIGAGILAAVVVFAAYLAAPSAPVLGSLHVTWEAPPRTDVDAIARALSAHGKVRVARDGNALTLDVPGVEEADLAWSMKELASGGLSFHRVVEGSTMAFLGQQLNLSYDKQANGVRVVLDAWSTSSTDPTRHHDSYLAASDPALIVAKLDEAVARGWHMPEGTLVAFEYTDDFEWRTYLVEREPAVDRGHIEDARIVSSGVVQLDLDPEGTRQFSELTATMVGKKLAIMGFGQVVTAPIIDGAIRRGHLTISTRDKDRERAILLAATTSALPPDGTVRDGTYIPPTDSGLRPWLERGGLALLAGALVALLAWAVVRTARPVWRTPPRLPGRVAWWRLAVTLLAPISVIAAGFIRVPGVDVETLHDRGVFDIPVLGTLGLAPLFGAFVIVELIATIIPSWRRRRHAGAIARLPFDIATLVLAVAIAIAQSWYLAFYLEPYDALVGYGRLLFFASIVATTLGFAGIAWVIRRFGAGNGYTALLAAGALATFLELTRTPAPPMESADPSGLAGLVACTALAIVFGVSARWRIARIGEAPLRVPASGLVPALGVVGAVWLVWRVLGALPFEPLMNQIYRLEIWASHVDPSLGMFCAAVLAALFAWMFAHPTLLRDVTRRAQLSPPSFASWRAAAVLSIALAIAATGTEWFVNRTVHGASAGVLTAIVLAAFVLDIVDDLRGRRGTLARAWSLHAAQHADLAAHVLEREGIAFHLASANTRTLFAWFAPFASVDVWVRPADAVRAREALANVFAAK